MNKKTSRIAILAAVMLLIGMGVTAWWGVPLILIGAYLLQQLCRDPHDGVLLIGPIAWSELTRRARRQRPWVWRMLCVGVAVLIVVGNLDVYGNYDLGNPQNRRRVEQVNQQILNWFAVCLIGGTALLTLQLSCSAIAEERLGRRWDILRTTDLRPREILLGLLVARLPTILDPLLAVAPVLALLPLLGGVAPSLIAAIVIACVALAFGLGMAGLFFSLFVRKPGDAMGAVAGVVMVYYAFSWALMPNPYFSFHYNWLWWLGWGSPIILVREYETTGGSAEHRLLVAAWHFATAMTAFFLLFLFIGLRRLPTAEVWQKPTAPQQDIVKDLFRRFRNRRRERRGKAPVAAAPVKPAIDRPAFDGDEPVVWWERYGWLNAGQADFINKLTDKTLRKIFLFMLLACLLRYPLDILFDIIRMAIYGGPNQNIGLATIILQIGIGAMGAFTAFVLVFPPLFRGAKCIVRERKADTLEPLLLTDLTPSEIIYQKWKGICLCDWPTLKVFLAIFAPATLTFLLPWQAVLGGILAILVVPVLTMFMAMLGVLISIGAKSLLQANVASGICLCVMLYMFGALNAAIGMMLRRQGWPAVAVLGLGEVCGLALVTWLFYRSICRRFANGNRHALN